MFTRIDVYTLHPPMPMEARAHTRTHTHIYLICASHLPHPCTRASHLPHTRTLASHLPRTRTCASHLSHTSPTTADAVRLCSWAAHRQGSFEGGFNGRTNKLVDGCYSFWQGGLFSVLQLLGPEVLWQAGKQEPGQAEEEAEPSTKWQQQQSGSCSSSGGGETGRGGSSGGRAWQQGGQRGSAGRGNGSGNVGERREGGGGHRAGVPEGEAGRGVVPPCAPAGSESISGCNWLLPEVPPLPPVLAQVSLTLDISPYCMIRPKPCMTHVS